MTNLLLPLLLPVFLSFPVCQSLEEMQVKAGSFSPIVVEFRESADDAGNRRKLEKILENIKLHFERASLLLFESTSAVKRPLQFGHVIIRVSDRVKQTLAASGSSLKIDRMQLSGDRANFGIDRRISVKEEGPIGQKQCGQQADMVAMAAESFETENSDVHRRIVSFFAQYRWGLYSEKPYTPMYKKANNRFAFASCSGQLRTRLRDGNGTCAFNPASKSFAPNCRLRVVEGQIGAFASLLFDTESASVSRFCDSRGDSRVRHNSKADSPMNEMCQGKSAGEVMREHPDFQGEKGSQVTGGSAAVTFSFTAEESRRRVVVVMDTSGSMSGSPLSQLKQVIRQFLSDSLETGAECALVKLTNRADILHSWVTVDSSKTRQQLVNAVEGLTAGGGTCIGGAVNKAMELLGVNPDSPSVNTVGQIILLSDGVEGCDQLGNAKSLVAQTGVQVMVVRYGDKADQRMGELARQNGGRVFFGDTASGTATSLAMAMQTTTQTARRQDRPITLTIESLPLNFKQKKIFVDDAVKRDLVFRLTFQQGSGFSSVRLSVTSPDGAVFRPKQSGADGLVIRIPNDRIRPGVWTLRNSGSTRSRSRRSTSSSSSSFSGLTVIGRPISNDFDDYSITLTASVYPQKLQQLTATTQVGVYASLLRGFIRVTGANVTVEVGTDQGRLMTVQLRDNGAGADATASDGTYSAFLPTLPLNAARDYYVTATSYSPVRRMASAGRLSVAQKNPRLTAAQPARIKDLRLVINEEMKTAMLTWTPADDPNGRGENLQHTVRYDKSSDQLLLNFSLCRVAWTGTQSQFDVYSLLEQTDGSLNFAVTSRTAAGVESEVSNVEAGDLFKISVQELENLGVVVEEERKTTQTEESTTQERKTTQLEESTTAAGVESGVDGQMEFTEEELKDLGVVFVNEKESTTQLKVSATSQTEVSTTQLKVSATSQTEVSTTPQLKNSGDFLAAGESAVAISASIVVVAATVV